MEREDGRIVGFFLIRFAAGREREREGRRKKEGEGGLTLFTRRSNSGFRIEIKRGPCRLISETDCFWLISISRILEFVEEWDGFEKTRSWNCPWKEGHEEKKD